MFLTQIYNECGVYGISLTKNGRRIHVGIDDAVPCHINRKIAFIHAKGPELWPLILEKAWAKVHGSYDRIVDGRVDLTLRDLTGAPSFSYSISETPDMFELLAYAQHKNHIMCATTGNERELNKK